MMDFLWESRAKNDFFQFINVMYLTDMSVSIASPITPSASPIASPTALDLGVDAWFPVTHAIYIHFYALSGPSVVCKVSSDADTYQHMQYLAKNAFLQAFTPVSPMDQGYFTEQDKYHTTTCCIYMCEADGIVINTSVGYTGNYQCQMHSFILEESFPPETHEFISIYTSDDWAQLSDWEKQDTWAAELKTQLEQIVNKHKVTM